MPTYDYECTKCGDTFEAFQQITADPLTTCKKCGKKLRRLIGGGGGILFKGSGFYETDYRSQSYKKGAEKDSGDKKPSKPTDGKKSSSEGSDSKKKSEGT
ncbi:MAG: zinc ribbon domain-containing protein [Candidatus Omnitrophota bacterium]|nr:zinc ribbon domain-containing protein [Candidatus Omnitrophota bacterium]